MNPAQPTSMSQKLPAAMVFALSALGLIVIVQFVLGLAILVGLTKGPPAAIVGAIAGAVLWLGLYYRQKWAFVVVVIVCPLNVLISVFRGGSSVVVAVILNGLVLVPLLMSTGFYWGVDRMRAELPSETSR